MTDAFYTWQLQLLKFFQDWLRGIATAGRLSRESILFKEIRKSTAELQQHNQKRQALQADRVKRAKEELPDQKFLEQAQEILFRSPNAQDTEEFFRWMNQVRKRPLPSVLALKNWQTHCWQNRHAFLNRLAIKKWYRFYWDAIFLQHDPVIQAEWGRALGAWFGPAMSDPDIVNHTKLMPWKACMLACLKSNASAFSLSPDATKAYVDACYQKVSDLDKQDLNRLTQAIAQQIGIPTDSVGIRLYCEKYLFDALLNRYLNDVTDTTVLEQLLSQFCDWTKPEGLERFNTVVQKSYEGPEGLVNLNERLKGVIQTHLKSTVGDPRLKHADWGKCQGQFPELYRRIKAWFVQADFEFFIRYAFGQSNKVDTHRRNKFWSQYLSQAEDFRVFLPERIYKKFMQEEPDVAQRSLIYENLDDITGFVMLLNNVLIYEAVESPNAAYIYDLEVLRNDNRNEAIQITKFVKEMEQGKTSSNRKHSRRLFKNEYLAPLPSEAYKEPHRRFTHDKDQKWHWEVSHFLSKNFFIDPDKQ